MQYVGSKNGVCERMANYAAKRERSTPPVFVGRRTELAALQSDVAQAATDNPRGMLRVVQGVPGSGKTSLSEAFMAAVQGRRVGGLRVLCASPHVSDLNMSPLRFVTALNEDMLHTQALLSGKAGRLGGVRLHTRQMIAIAAQLGFKTTEYKLTDAAHGLTDESSLSACINAYASHMWPDDVVVALTLDEMQNCPVTQRTKDAIGILNERKHSARIAISCFGLLSTEAVLREHLGLSRLSEDAVMGVGTLLPGEGREVLEKTLDHLGMTAENDEWRRYVSKAGFGDQEWRKWRADLVAGLERRCGDFPQHLTAGLVSVCKSLLDNRRRFSPHDNLLNDIAERQEANMAHYYRQRLSGPLLENHDIAFGAICRLSAQAADGAVPWRDALAAVAAGGDDGLDVNGAQAKQALDAAVNAGVLGKTRKASMPHALPPPIPSMGKHLAALFDQAVQAEHPSALAMRDRLEL